MSFFFQKQIFPSMPFHIEIWMLNIKFPNFYFESMRWLTLLYIVWPDYIQKYIQCDRTFYNILSGNQCRAILKKISQLKIPSKLRQFEVVLRRLRDVHFLCSHEVLPGNYAKILDNFSFEWFKLSDEFGLTTTPKIHIIVDHLCDYFDETNLSLLQTSDEVVENFHQFMHKRMMMRYWVKDISNPNHWKKTI